jgi:hypothetical protein
MERRNHIGQFSFSKDTFAFLYSWYFGVAKNSGVRGRDLVSRRHSREG